MSSPIPFLSEALLIAALCFPAGLNALVPGRRDRSFAASTAVNLGIYAALLFLVLLASGASLLVPRFSGAYLWYAGAVAAGAAIVGLEYLIGGLQVLARSGSWPRRAAAHAYYRGGRAPLDLLLIAALALLEELVFRQVFVTAFVRDFGLGTFAAMAAGAVLYSLNHAYFGRDALSQKLASGAAYCALFLLSGGDVLVPVVAHFVQNALVYALSRADGARKAGATAKNAKEAS